MIAAAFVLVAAALPLSGTTVHVDAGHNGANGADAAQINRLVPAGSGGFRKACDTAGAQTNDGRLTEARLNLDVARRLQRRLEALGARVVMTRTTNAGVGPCVSERAAIGNRARADVALSIHADGGPPGGHGFHVIAPLARRAVEPAIVAPSLRFARELRARLDGIGLRSLELHRGRRRPRPPRRPRRPEPQPRAEGVRRARQHAQRLRRAAAEAHVAARQDRRGARARGARGADMTR